MVKILGNGREEPLRWKSDIARRSHQKSRKETLRGRAPSVGLWGRGFDGRTRRRRRLQRTKRAFDLALVILSAPLWILLMACIALVIRVTSPTGPVLFTQERTGRGGRRFKMLKFRTMVPDAEELRPSLSHLNELPWPDFKIRNDPRVTRIGRILRRTSLDELPQLVNVLRGDMSLVGPRPTSFSADTYDPWQKARLNAVPGLTGVWQVEARNEVDFAERSRMDISYVRRHGLLYDLRILASTIGALFGRRRGY